MVPGQVVEESRVPRLGIHMVARSPTQENWDVCDVLVVEDHRDELGVSSLGIVDDLRDDATLPRRAQTFSWSFALAHAPVIRRRAHHEHEVGIVDLVRHPCRPPVGRRAVHVAVESRIDAYIAEPVAQGEYASPVRLRVVAVADKDARRSHGGGVARHGEESWRHLRFPSE